MAANRVGRRLGRGSPARSPGSGSPRREPARSPGIQKRQARVTVKYDRRELQRRLDTEKWVDGRLEELYRGREAEMPDEVNIDELLELDTDEARAMQLRDRLWSISQPLSVHGGGAGRGEQLLAKGILKSCQNNTQAFVQELLLKLRGLQKQQVLRRASPEIQGRV